MSTSPDVLRDLPGAELVLPGLRDAVDDKETVERLLVQIGAPRLRRAGLHVPPTQDPAPELRLHRLLEAIDPRDVHARFNALIRRLVSFEDAIDARLGRERRRRARDAGGRG